MATEFISNSWLMPTNANAEANRVSNYSLSFNGTDETISISDLQDFGGGSLTISFWIKSGVDASNAYVLMRSGFSFFIFQNGTNASLRYRLKTSVTNQLDGGTTLDNNWHHCVMTFDSSANEFKIFEDGSQVGTTTTTSGSLASSTATVYLASFENSSNFKSGNLTEVSFFDYALSASQVTQLYGTGSAIGNPMSLATKPVAYYPLGQSAFNGEFLATNKATELYENYALDFDGTDDDMTITNINLGTTNTISYWMKSDGTDRTDMICNAYGASRIYGPAPTVLFYYANNNYAYWLNNTGGNIDLNDDNWHHMCFVRNGTSIDFYADGVLQTISVNNITATDEYQFTNFMRPPSTSRYTKGTISNLSVYSTNISSAQVTTLYNEGKPFDLNTFAVTPLNWWRLGSVNSSYNSTTSEWTILDEVATNHATGTNLAQTALVDGVGATGSGTSSGMSSGTNKTGDAPYSNSNAVSYNMSVTAKSTSVPT